jgi:hypothetical protein
MPGAFIGSLVILRALARFGSYRQRSPAPTPEQHCDYEERPASWRLLDIIESAEL